MVRRAGPDRSMPPLSIGGEQRGAAEAGAGHGKLIQAVDPHGTNPLGIQGDCLAGAPRNLSFNFSFIQFYLGIHLVENRCFAGSLFVIFREINRSILKIRAAAD